MALVKDNRLLVTIGVLLFSAGGLFYVSYDTAKSAKTKTESLEIRMNTVEREAARFEGVMNERTQNIQENVKTIGENIIKLLENLELSEGNSDAKSEAQT